jgi:hypothetical protein
MTKKLPEKFKRRMEKLYEDVTADGCLNEFIRYLETDYDLWDYEHARDVIRDEGP